VIWHKALLALRGVNVRIDDSSLVAERLACGCLDRQTVVPSPAAAELPSVPMVHIQWGCPVCEPGPTPSVIIESIRRAAATGEHSVESLLNLLGPAADDLMLMRILGLTAFRELPRACEAAVDRAESLPLRAGIEVHEQDPSLLWALDSAFIRAEFFFDVDDDTWEDVVYVLESRVWHINQPR
jgi:hypothetical protein